MLSTARVQGRSRIPAGSSDRGPSVRQTVLFVCLATGLGGSTRSLATVLQHLGPDVTRIVAGPETGPFSVLVKDRSIVDGYVPIRKLRSGPVVRLSRLAAAARITRWAWRHRRSITAIHANGPEELNLVVPAAVAGRIPIVLWSHARDVSPWMRRLAPLWSLLLRGRRVRWAAVSPMAGRVLVESGLAPADAVAIVPNPIDPADVRASRRDRTDPLVVAYLGSDARYKGFQLLPEVVDRLRDAPVRWLLFTNERSEENAEAWQRLRAMPEELVLIAGKVPDVRVAYAQCDVVFIPSLDESFCRVAAEAMVNGIPVVASDLEPVRDLLGDGQAGLLFPPGDTAAAADVLRRLVSHPALLGGLSERGRTRAESFEPRSIVDQLADLYGVVRR